MSTPKRPAPRRSSLAGTSPVRPAESAPSHPETPQPTETERPPSAPRKKKTAAASTRQAQRKPTSAEPVAGGVSHTARLGVYLTPEEFTNAKAAYLAAWQLGGEADTFARWIGAALERHARRSATERADLARAHDRGDARRGGAARSFNVPTDTLTRMREAITADQHAGRWPTDSAWSGDAIAAEVEETRTANGGALPTPPPRLPNRLKR